MLWNMDCHEISVNYLDTLAEIQGVPKKSTSLKRHSLARKINKLQLVGKAKLKRRD